MSEVKVNKISPRSGTDVQLGDSGDTITVPTGATLDASNATTTLPSNIVTTTGSQTLTNKSIDASQLTGTITPSDNTVSLAKLTATGTKDATTFLRGDNTFASAGGTNTPAFQAVLSSTQNTSDLATTKIQFNSEDFDTDNAYDNSTNYRFTPQTSGKYFVYASFIGRSNLTDELTNLRTYIYKNGSSIKEARIDVRDRLAFELPTYMGTIVDMNGSTDYIEYYARVDHAGTGGIKDGSYCGAYKIIE